MPLFYKHINTATLSGVSASSVNHVVVLDCSGSMCGDFNDLKHFLKQFHQSIPQFDLIIFGSNVEYYSIHEGTQGIVDLIVNLGSTNAASAIDKITEVLIQKLAGNSHAQLTWVSDGLPNCYESTMMAIDRFAFLLCNKQFNSRIKVAAINYGVDSDTRVATQLAALSHGHGQFIPVERNGLCLSQKSFIENLLFFQPSRSVILHQHIADTPRSEADHDRIVDVDNAVRCEFGPSVSTHRRDVPPQTGAADASVSVDHQAWLIAPSPLGLLAQASPVSHTLYIISNTCPHSEDPALQDWVQLASSNMEQAQCLFDMINSSVLGPHLLSPLSSSQFQCLERDLSTIIRFLKDASQNVALDGRRDPALRDPSAPRNEGVQRLAGELAPSRDAIANSLRESMEIPSGFSIIRRLQKSLQSIRRFKRDQSLKDVRDAFSNPYSYRTLTKLYAYDKNILDEFFTAIANTPAVKPFLELPKWHSVDHALTSFLFLNSWVESAESLQDFVTQDDYSMNVFLNPSDRRVEMLEKLLLTCCNAAGTPVRFKLANKTSNPWLTVLDALESSEAGDLTPAEVMLMQKQKRRLPLQSGDVDVNAVAILPPLAWMKFITRINLHNVAAAWMLRNDPASACPTDAFVLQMLTIHALIKKSCDSSEANSAALWTRVIQHSLLCSFMLSRKLVGFAEFASNLDGVSDDDDLPTNGLSKEINKPDELLKYMSFLYLHPINQLPEKAYANLAHELMATLRFHQHQFKGRYPWTENIIAVHYFIGQFLGKRTHDYSCVAPFDGTVTVDSLKDDNSQLLASTITIRAQDGTKHCLRVPFGAQAMVNDEDDVTQGQALTQWTTVEPHRQSLYQKHAGLQEAQDTDSLDTYVDANYPLDELKSLAQEAPSDTLDNLMAAVAHVADVDQSDYTQYLEWQATIECRGKLPSLSQLKQFLEAQRVFQQEYREYRAFISSNPFNNTDNEAFLTRCFSSQEVPYSIDFFETLYRNAIFSRAFSFPFDTSEAARAGVTFSTHWYQLYKKDACLIHPLTRTAFAIASMKKILSELEDKTGESIAGTLKTYLFDWDSSPINAFYSRIQIPSMARSLIEHVMTGYDDTARKQLLVEMSAHGVVEDVPRYIVEQLEEAQIAMERQTAVSLQADAPSVDHDPNQHCAQYLLPAIDRIANAITVSGVMDDLGCYPVHYWRSMVEPLNKIGVRFISVAHFHAINERLSFAIPYPAIQRYTRESRRQSPGSNHQVYAKIFEGNGYLNKHELPFLLRKYLRDALFPYDATNPENNFNQEDWDTYITSAEYAVLCDKTRERHHNYFEYWAPLRNLSFFTDKGAQSVDHRYAQAAPLHAAQQFNG